MAWSVSDKKSARINVCGKDKQATVRILVPPSRVQRPTFLNSAIIILYCYLVLLTYQMNGGNFHEKHGCKDMRCLELHKKDRDGRRKETVQGKIDPQGQAIQEIKNGISHGNGWQNTVQGRQGSVALTGS